MANSNFFLKGESYALRELRVEDVDGNYGRWLNDSEIVRYNSHGRIPMSRSRLLDYVQSTAASDAHIVLAVIDLADSNHIGNISLQAINWVDRNAEIAFLLGERKYWGEGVMFEVGSLLIAHGFNSLNLHRIYCGTSSDNTGMQKLALKLGMKAEGTRKDAIYNNGEYFDLLEYGILNDQ